jgi:DtxR family Mn-dependent transcriptional regulator
VVTGVDDHSPAFLQYLQQLGLTLGVAVTLLERIEYDHSLRVLISGKGELTISDKVGRNLFVRSDRS